MGETPQPHLFKYQSMLTTILCINNVLVHYQETQNTFFKKCDVIANRLHEASGPLPEFKSVGKKRYCEKPCDQSGWWN